MAHSQEPARLGTILMLIMAIVASVVILNGISPNEQLPEDQDIYIPPYSAGEYVEYVYDGDTFKTVEGDIIRMLGINTEEKGMPHADTAKHHLQLLLNSGQIRLERDEVDKDRYGRLLRHVWAGEIHVNAEMVRGGYAHVYIIEPNVKYSDALWAAQEEAAAAQLVLWERSPYAVEITEIQPIQGFDQEGLNLELVTFSNVGQASVSFNGWTVKDESTHIYRFDGITLPPGGSLSLRSGLGTDTSNDVYWQMDSSIWNNAGDVCFLRDENGLLIDSWRYWLEGDEYVFFDYVD